MHTCTETHRLFSNTPFRPLFVLYVAVSLSDFHASRGDEMVCSTYDLIQLKEILASTVQSWRADVLVVNRWRHFPLFSAPLTRAEPKEVFEDLCFRRGAYCPRRRYTQLTSIPLGHKSETKEALEIRLIFSTLYWSCND